MILKKGNILEASESIIMHGCNAQGKMNNGVAKTIKQFYPEVYDKYISSSMKLGTFNSVLTSDGKYTIINAITQQYYGTNKRYVSYDAICEIAININSEYNGNSIAIPQIGAGLGGGNWNVIESIFTNYAPNINWVLYIL